MTHTLILPDDRAAEAALSLLGAGVVAALWYFAAVQFFPQSTPIPTEVIGTWLVLSNVYLIVKQNNWCWPIGIVGVGFFGYALMQYGLYSTAALNILYFIPVQLYGWYKWLYGRDGEGIKHPSWMTWSGRGLAVVSIAIVTIAWGALMVQLGASFAFLDSLVLAISVTSQFLLSYKKIESWIGWVTVDVLSVWMFFAAGSMMASALYLVFFFLASRGLYEWWKDWRAA
jgi:nicotinamide mononucleotide transporter